MELSLRTRFLLRYLWLETNNIDEVSERISWARRHRLERLPCSNSPYFSLCYVPINQSAFGLLRTSGTYGDRVEPSETATSVLFVLRGRCEHSLGRQSIPLDGETAAVHSILAPARFATCGYSEMLSFTIRKSAIRAEAENLLGRSIQKPIEFVPSMRLTTAAGIQFRRVMLQLCELLDHTSAGREDMLAIRQAERWLISHLLISQRHNYTRLLHRVSAAGPWQMRAAEEFIRANAGTALTLGDIAAAAGVSARTLQHSFRRHRGMGPIEFLRRIRLEHVRDELLSENKPATVTEAAMRWGFSHFGRFAADYQEQYGETPSASLRRGKSSNVSAAD